MSEQDNPDTSTSDPVHNVKQEFNRKLGNVEAKMSQLEQTNAALLQQLQNMVPAKQEPAVASRSINDVWLDNPEAAASMVAEAAEARVMSRLTAQAQESNTIAQLASEFPELTDNNSALTKRAIEVYGAFSKEDKKSPVAYKAAVREAAMELGIVSKSKREQYEDDVSIKGSGASRARQEQGNKRRDSGVDADTAEFARLVGVDIDDPKVKERIKSRHSRRTYSRWE